MKRGISNWTLLALVFFFAFSVLSFVQNASAADRSDVEAFVTRFYYYCLGGRQPDSAGLNGWVNALLDGSKTGRDVAYGFVFSPEFIGFNTSATEYLNVLYSAFFNRPPDAAGFQQWLDTLQPDTLDNREHVLNGFIGSSEFDNLCQTYGIRASGDAPTDPRGFVEAFVTRFYKLCLGRAPDPAGLNGWVNNLLNQTKAGADVAEGFIYSNEFIGFNTTNSQYLMILYQAFFSRDADTAGWNTWLSELNSGRDRGEVLDGFIYSQEFANLCDSYGIIPVKGNGIPPVTPTCQNVAGSWSVTENVAASDCTSAYSEVNPYRISQNGCAISVTDDEQNSYSGTVNGNHISWSGSYPEDGGTTTTTLSLNISGNSLSGSATWTWTYPGYPPCHGTSQISGTRN